MSNRKRKQYLHQQKRLRFQKTEDKYVPPDIENCSQLLQVINTGLATYGQVTITVWPKSTKSPYWSIMTLDLSQTVRPWHVRLIIERKLIHLYDMSPGEFLGQDALGTLEGKIIIGFTDPNQIGLGLK